ncbi:MAG TPA: hypothetical protein VEA37_14065 [Flavobacterium sp.]|nr:hypothetical protein [Flavobacterium sp.]
MYQPLTESEYSLLNSNDTIIFTHKLLVTCTGNAGNYNDMGTICVRKTFSGGIGYFKLAHDVYFQNSTTLIEYQGFFSSGDDGPFQKNGIWVYTDFYKEPFKSGMNFAVDSLPPGYDDINRPNIEGIYFYEHKGLWRISKGQSEEEFQKFGKDGFYFIPNSGRFFKKHNAGIIK